MSLLGINMLKSLYFPARSTLFNNQVDS